MRTLLLLMALALVSAASPPAVEKIERIETTDGRIFEGVSGIKVMPNEIRFMHRDGAASVRMEDLPETLRQAIGYDPTAAAKQDAEDKANEDAYYEAIEKQEAADRAHSDKVQIAIAKLRKLNYGGALYRTQNGNDRARRDRHAAKLLLDAGCTQPQAEAIMKRMREEGMKQPIKRDDPEWLRQRNIRR
jgi:hypothetical protein